jgi:hypothetical protein
VADRYSLELTTISGFERAHMNPRAESSDLAAAPYVPPLFRIRHRQTLAFGREWGTAGQG